MKQQLNEIKRMQKLAGVLNENISTATEAEKILTGLVQDYISDAIDSAGEELDWGKGIMGYDDKNQLVKDFITYLESSGDTNDEE